MAKESTKHLDIWYFDSYASRHIYNNKCFFSNFCLKSYKFIIAKREIIKSKKTGTIYLSIYNRSIIIFNNIVYILKCNSNLILLGPLQELTITYYDHLKQMILKQEGNTIGLASKYKNHFILDTKITKKVMIIKEKRLLTYLQSQNSQIRLQH